MNDCRKLKILHILKSSIYSGAENVAITIIKHLENEHELMYVAMSGEIEKMLEKEEIPHVLLTKYTRKNIQKVIKDFCPEIVHAHDFTATVICSSIPGDFYLISHLHYDPPWTKRWNLKTLVYAFSGIRISKILAVSRKSFDNMVFSSKLRKKCIVVGNPMDVNKILMLGEMGESEKKYDLIFVGRLVEQKNPQRFLRIVDMLKKDGVFLKCAMIGEGELRTECEHFIMQYELQNQVELLGFKDNPYIYMKQSRLVCMTSKWEGYGLVLLEANILGIPVVSSCTSGSVEVLGENAEELCHTDEEFVCKIKNILLNIHKYEKWKNLTQERASQILKADEYVKLIGKIYQDLIWS